MNAVRRAYVAELEKKLTIDSVSQSSMESREGPEYAFNLPLLEDELVRIAQLSSEPKNVIVSMMFFLPGRHAGSNGDVHEIIEEAKSKHPNLQVTMTPLVGESKSLAQIINQRIQSK